MSFEKMLKVVCDDCGSHAVLPEQGSVEANVVMVERELGWMTIKGMQFCCYCKKFHVEVNSL